MRTIGSTETLRNWVRQEQVAQGLGGANPEFPSDRLHRGPLGVVLRPHLSGHPHRTVAQLNGILDGRAMA
ncbi:hypothetical protein DY245_18075 [Streptomyces inhibens]|uniref:Uncharacterized protein n=1 Tax=Streptomyces inhibens TaxID=2293571 RepID=A0A371Q2Z1_STRIH|nr:hypothetical protein DY245_18075 [Streptomyces inhibens]